MRVFVCVVNPHERDPGVRLRRYESLPRRRGLRMQWSTFEHAAVLTAWDEQAPPRCVEQDGHSIAVGTVRLDNPGEVSRLVGGETTGLSDLALVLKAVGRLGPECIAEFLGDFAVLVWDPAARRGVAACDALGVRKLFYQDRQGCWAFASHAEALAEGAGYDVEYLAEQVTGCATTPGLTVYEGVRAVPAGSMIPLSTSPFAPRRYWFPETFAYCPQPALAAPEAVDEFRRLFVEAVRSRLPDHGSAWAQLSGGLDSSSVVSVAQWLVSRGEGGRGLDGTVTYVDRQGTAADERVYSSAVAGCWGLRNETILDPPLWYDERHAPPRLDQPRHNFMFYPRESRLCEIVQGSGGRVLLTGQGPDEYLRGCMFFFADWIARGKVRAALAEMARRAAIGRVSFWNLAYQNAVMPLLPELLRQRLGPSVTRLPAWIRPSIARRYDLRRRGFELSLYSGPLASKYQHTLVKGVAVLAGTIGHLVLDDSLDVRHPFLDRRLIEFSLGLAPELTVQPYAGKWVLREAMQGIVPEVVRTRVGKGTQAERHAWALSEQRMLLEPLVQDPILAELGIVDRGRLQSAFLNMPHQPRRNNDPHAAMEQVLAIEAWLQLQAGRWPRGLLD